LVIYYALIDYRYLTVINLTYELIIVKCLCCSCLC